MRHGYDSNGRPEYLTGTGSYVADVLRAPTGEALRYGMGNTWSKAIWARQAHTSRSLCRRHPKASRRRVNASASTSGRLQNAQRTSGAPACLSS